MDAPTDGETDDDDETATGADATESLTSTPSPKDASAIVVSPPAFPNSVPTPTRTTTSLDGASAGAVHATTRAVTNFARIGAIVPIAHASHRAFRCPVVATFSMAPPPERGGDDAASTSIEVTDSIARYS